MPLVASAVWHASNRAAAYFQVLTQRSLRFEETYININPEPKFWFKTFPKHVLGEVSFLPILPIENLQEMSKTTKSYGENKVWALTFKSFYVIFI